MARRCIRHVSTDDQNVIYHPQEGLPALPLELLLLVVSHMRGPVIPWYEECPMWNEDRQRRESLRALCQLCRSLRRALLPVLWERFEACTVHRPASGPITSSSIAVISGRLGQEVVGQLNLMIDLTLPYASYVRVVNVAIEPRFSPTALPKLARAMALMPNLHTIQIVCKSRMHRRCKADRFEKAFKKRVYPSVRCASLPHQATSILSSFPEVVEIYINQMVWKSQFDKFVQAVALHCPKVESFGYWQSYLITANIISQTLPNLRRLECYFRDIGGTNRLLNLEKLENLEKLTLTIEPHRHPTLDQEIPAIPIDIARKMFAGSSSPKKSLVVHFHDHTRVETFCEV